MVTFIRFSQTTSESIPFSLVLDPRDDFLRRSATPAIICQSLPHASVHTIYATHAPSWRWSRIKPVIFDYVFLPIDHFYYKNILKFKDTLADVLSFFGRIFFLQYTINIFRICSEKIIFQGGFQSLVNVLSALLLTLQSLLFLQFVLIKNIYNSGKLYHVQNVLIWFYVLILFVLIKKHLIKIPGLILIVTTTD